MPGRTDLCQNPDMIVVAGRVRVKAQKLEEAMKLALEEARATREEPGCLSYRFYRDLEESDVFFVFEEWETARDLARHFQTDHLKRFRERLPGLLAGPTGIQQYEIRSVGPA